MGNRNMAAKHDKAKQSRATFCADLALKSAAYQTETKMADQTRLASFLASRPDTVSVNGVTVSRCDDIAARKASRQTIRSTHW